MNVVLFADQEDFRKWLAEHHETENEIWVGYYKISAKKQGMTYSQSVDQAICYGWIDGIKKAVDSEIYCNRFTPRRATSVWSAVNIKKAESLIKQGLMQPSGLTCYLNRKEDKSRVYSYENKPERLPEELEEKLRENDKAWAYFSSQAPSHQRTILYWIMSAKQDSTRLNRLEKLIKASEEGKRL